jgi:hypothetical protein
MSKTVELLCTLHNTISPESIHLALHDMEDNVVLEPDMSLEKFLDLVLRQGQWRDDVRFSQTTRDSPIPICGYLP